MVFVPAFLWALNLFSWKYVFDTILLRGIISVRYCFRSGSISCVCTYLKFHM